MLDYWVKRRALEAVPVPVVWRACSILQEVPIIRGKIEASVDNWVLPIV